jgi:hypothetical protein
MYFDLAQVAVSRLDPYLVRSRERTKSGQNQIICGLIHLHFIYYSVKDEKKLDW